MSERLSIIRHFIVARWGGKFASREALLAWQGRRLEKWLGHLAPGRCRGVSARLFLNPILDKGAYRARFHELNPHGIILEEAEQAALKAETDRDFSPALRDGITVGLSSGSSGRRGVFLVSPEDRHRWAGIILGRALSTASLKQIITPWKRPLKIAFFLRANSNLYRTIASRRIDFRYFDLLEPFDDLMDSLQAFQPDILIAPATVLAEIAKVDHLAIHPMQVISVAEVLDGRDEAVIHRKFGIRPSQIYQATEGFLAWTCAAGRLHLNEEYLHVEREWLDQGKTRFHPVITDFSRSGQWFIRHRLDDILVPDDRACPCGRHTQVIRSIEGRADEVLRFPEPVFPDTIRQILYALPVAVGAYRIEQHGGEIHVYLKESTADLEALVRGALGARLPGSSSSIHFMPWTDQPAGEKQRRIRCITPLP